MKKILAIDIEGCCITAICDNNEMLMVDSGYPGSIGKIEQALLDQNANPEDLKQIVITHHDQDHIGGLKELVERYPDVIVMSSKEQIPYITGKKKSLRLVEAECMFHSLPEEQKAESLENQKFIKSIRPVEKVTAVEPGEILPIYGGIEIIDTAGHQPGHISVYIREEKTLVAGDALIQTEEGQLRANPLYTMDMVNAVKSAKRLLDYEIDKVICYHGGVFEGNVREALTEMIHEQG